MGWIASDLNPRCKHCGKLLAEKVTRPWRIVCYRCHTPNDYSTPAAPREIILEAAEDQ